MNFNIKGHYKFKIKYSDGTVKIIEDDNLITFFGESFFLNRPINDNFNTMKYIVLGNADNRPRKMDKSLGNETVRKECVRQADLDNKRILLTANFKTSDVLGTREIGVANDSILISHDVYDKITSETVSGNVGDIEVEYSFQLYTSSIRSDWNKYVSGYADYSIYYCGEPNEIIGVLESNTGCGYRKTSSMEELIRYKGAYYYNRSLGQLYIRTSKASDPSVDTILVQTK